MNEVEEKYIRRPLTPEDIDAMLPEVGDRLELSPSHGKEVFGRPAPPRGCTVVYVNRPHSWFRVRFDSGTYECYKVPDLMKLPPRGGVR